MEVRSFYIYRYGWDYLLRYEEKESEGKIVIELKVKFYEVEKDGLPMKSGDYLCFVDNLYYTSLSFSARHKAFNCYDRDDIPDSKIEDVTFWAKYPIRA